MPSRNASPSSAQRIQRTSRSFQSPSPLLQAASPPSSPRHRPSLARGASTPPRRHYDLSSIEPNLEGLPDPLSPDGAFYNPGASAFDFAGSSHLERRRLRRGLTYEEVKQGGILDDKEASKDFEGIPLDDDDIKKLPRKLRPYYEHMAELKDHYDEVDTILSGSLPYTVASSFTPSQKGKGKTYTQLLTDLAEEFDTEEEGWLRRNSTWRVKQHHRDSPSRKRSSAEYGSNGVGNGEMENGMAEGDEEVGERTGLLDTQEREQKRERVARLALHVNTVVNVLLVAAKAVAVLYSSSVSLIASLVDSSLDLLSTFIILGTSLAIGMKTDRHMYPAGKRRFEPLGVLIFSVAMIASFVQVFIESVQRARAPAEEPANLSMIGIATMLATIGVKGVIWVWCSRIPSSGIQALAQDAENDVFFNIMSLAFPYLGSLLKWRLLDPIGGMVLSSYIIIEWVKTLLENFENLSGKAASRDQVTRVLYLVSRFNPVLEIADVECYHIGDDLIVEVDVILPRSSTLHFAHDVGETIQCCLENLDGVIRAYVHTDYSSSNPAQHTTRTPVSPAPDSSQNKPKGNTSKKSPLSKRDEDQIKSPATTSGSVTPRPIGTAAITNGISTE